MRIHLTKSQWARVSELSGNGGLLVLGSIVIPFLLGEPDLPGVIRGLVIALFLWYISLYTARKY